MPQEKRDAQLTLSVVENVVGITLRRESGFFLSRSFEERYVELERLDLPGWSALLPS